VDLKLTGQCVVIAGGASHIGRQIVLSFAAEGARLAVLDLDARQLQQTVSDAHTRGAADAIAIPADLADHATATAACEEAIIALGGVDVLVNNVGWAAKPCFFLDVDPSTWSTFNERNLHPAMSCVRAVLPGMIERRRGSIVSTASLAAFGSVTESVYGAAKAALVNFTRIIADEYGRYGIRANCVAPGFVLPEDAQSIGEMSLWKDGPQAHMSEQLRETVIKATPLRRLSTTADIANATLFLASDYASRQITGDVLVVAGGMHR
jgi:2-hydroxycyclohexanecarboxyl-CoA dehydrogenase